MTQNCPVQCSPTDTRVTVKPHMLLHACCAPCSSSVIERLQQHYALTLFYYNPNIHPEREYHIRCDEMVRWCQTCELPLIVSDYEPQYWQQRIKGYELEPERGERCTLCYQLRLEKTLQQAKVDGFDLFTTVLSISPHKDADRINQIGDQLVSDEDVDFYTANFKKQGGFQRSLEISKEQGFYRQNYCGCRYSLAQSEQRRRQRSADRTPK
ncbi:MAG: epoxyqueuosine reductase QueH [Thermodesulfobacteriota bacterium]|nr:epoxyqueuosine reductase QueH [Thermodesulfobacteriota bacterium]